MNSTQDRYDELDNIVRTLQVLIDEISDEDYKTELRETLYRAEEELEDIGEILRNEQYAEYEQANLDYERSVS